MDNRKSILSSLVNYADDAEDEEQSSPPEHNNHKDDARYSSPKKEHNNKSDLNKDLVASQQTKERTNRNLERDVRRKGDHDSSSHRHHHHRHHRHHSSSSWSSKDRHRDGHRRSKSPTHRHRSPRSRSRSRDSSRHSSRPNSSKHSPKHKSRNCRKSKRDRSRSRSKESRRDYRRSYKSKSKSPLEKRLFEPSEKKATALASTTTVTKSVEQQMFNHIPITDVKSNLSLSYSGPTLPTCAPPSVPAMQQQLSFPSIPKYYNANSVNAMKIATQEEKRKLLWGDTKKDKASANNSSSSVWANLKFQGENGSQMTEKFRKLMGIKSNEDESAGAPSDSTKSSDISSTQEQLFQNLDMQYSIARMSTHTHRGVGLGFGTNSNRF